MIWGNNDYLKEKAQDRASKNWLKARIEFKFGTNGNICQEWTIVCNIASEIIKGSKPIEGN